MRMNEMGYIGRYEELSLKWKKLNEYVRSCEFYGWEA